MCAACGAPAALPPPPTGDYSQFHLPDGAQVLPPASVVPPVPPDPSTCERTVEPATRYPTATEPYGVVKNKSNDDLVRFVNATLERVRTDGTWMRLYDTWLRLVGPTDGAPAPSYRD